MDWRLQVATPANVSVATYGPGQVDGDGGIVSFDSFDVDSAGNCLTMQFSALPSRNAIGPRFIITLQLYDTGSSSWVSVWKGVVTTVGTTRSDRVQSYEALGLKQLMYEAPLERLPYWPFAYLTSTDAADLPDFDISQPLGVADYPGVTRDSDSTPTTGFLIGLTQTNQQTFGDFLDQRAAQVGAFVVPTGDTYVYDGVTFNAGDVVPPVRWGVDETGYFFFRRPFDVTLAIDETDANVSVQWLPISTENALTSPFLVLFPGGPQPNVVTVLRREVSTGGIVYSREFTQNLFDAMVINPSGILYPIAYLAPYVRKAIFITTPLDYMTRGSGTFSANPDWNDLPDGTDGDLTTYASVDPAAAVAHAAGSAVDWSDPSVVSLTGASYTYAAVVLWYSSDAPVPIRSFGQSVISGGPPAFTITKTTEVVFEFPATNTDTEIIPRQVVIPIVDTAPFGNSNLDLRSGLNILGVTGLRIYDCAVYNRDFDIVNRVLGSLIKPTQQEAAIVDLQGYQAIATELDIAPGDGGTNVIMPVERIEYTITVEGGIATRYYAGQRYDAGLEDEAAVLDALVRRLTKAQETL